MTAPRYNDCVSAVIDDVIRRRINGERLGDAQVISSHPDLMPELADWLGRLRLLNRARQRAHDTARIDADFADSYAPRLKIDGYEILREINRGGQAIVYLARVLETTELVAIKTLIDGTLADNKARARFEREARILAALDHPGIVKIARHGVTPAGVRFLVMPFIDGESFDSQFALTRSNNERLTHFVAILRAIGAAHARGVVHRDLKPSNIRIDRAGNPHVLDFGLARQFHAAQSLVISNSITATGQFVGSFPWASPEQAGSGDEITARSDVYSLGVMLFQLLTGGRFPYQVHGPLREVLNHIVKTKPSSPGANERIDAIVLKALAKEPAERYTDADDFADDLQRSLDGQATIAMQTIVRRRRMVAVIALFVIGLLAGLAVRWERSSQDRAEPLVNGRPRIDLTPNFSMIWIPPGNFVMGSPVSEAERLPDEEPHRVVIGRGFYMLMTEVPQETYFDVMGTNPSKFPGYVRPVEQVSWHDAQEFCRRFSRMTGRTIRLPTEVEWEFACRAGSTTPWSFGKNRELAPRYANFYDASSPPTRPGRSTMNDGYPQTSPAARFIANEFGLVDLHGNVWEWCQDEYTPYAGSGDEPTKPDSRRVARGGSWYDAIYSMRSAHRNPLDPSFKNDNLGFRVVMDEK